MSVTIPSPYINHIIKYNNISSFNIGLKVRYSTGVYVEMINIYETFNCGGVVRVSAMDESNQWHTLWSVPNPTRIQTSRIFSPPFDVRF